MAITHVVSVKKINATTTAADFSACNSTGLIVAKVGGFDVGTFSDSSSNTWTAGTTFTDAGSGGFIKTYYCVNPTATASHTFSWSGSFYSLVVDGYATVSAFDKSSGSNGDATSPGSLTPTAPNDGTSVFVSGYGTGCTGVSVAASFTLRNANDFSGGVNYGSALADLIQSASGAQNPVWSDASGTSGCDDFVFAPGAGGGGGGVTYPQLERTQRGVNRGRNTGIARSFVRRDRIYIPAYAEAA